MKISLDGFTKAKKGVGTGNYFTKSMVSYIYETTRHSLESKIGEFVDEVSICLKEEPHGTYTATIQGFFNSKTIVVGTTDADFYVAIESAAKKFIQKVLKEKEKKQTKLKNKHVETAETLKCLPVIEHAADKSEKNNKPFEIYKSKKFAIKPMDVEEAIMQMNLLGHDFFVYLDAETEEVNVVYKRKNGTYGLIEPTLK